MQQEIDDVNGTSQAGIRVKGNFFYSQTESF